LRTGPFEPPKTELGPSFVRGEFHPGCLVFGHVFVRVQKEDRFCPRCGTLTSGPGDPLILPLMVKAPSRGRNRGTRTMATVDLNKAWSRVKDLLAMLVIPLVLWGVKLEVSNALQDERVEQLQAALEEAQGVEKGVQENKLSLVRLESQVENANGKLDEIKDELRRVLP